MFYRTIWLYLFLLAIGYVAACDQEETKTAVPSPSLINLPTATSMETKTNTPRPTHSVDPATALPTETPQQTSTPLPQPTAVNPPTETPVSPTKTPTSFPTSVYNPDTIFSTSLSMSEQCTATNNAYYLRYRENIYVSELFRSPDNNYGLQQIGDSIWLGPLEDALTQLPITATDIGALSPYSFRWSPDSRYAALGRSDSRHPLWLASTNGRQLTLLTPEDHGVNFVAWSPDSQYLAWISRESESYGYNDKRVVIQSPDTHVPLISIANNPPIRGFQGIGWSFDSAYFAWIAVKAERSGELRIWSALENRQIYQTEVGQLYGASWSPQGHWLQGRHKINDQTHEHILLNADGSEFFRAPTTYFFSFPPVSPIWAPNGHALAVLDGQTSSNYTKIIVMSANGHIFEDILIDKRFIGRDVRKTWSTIHWLQDDYTLFYVKHQVEDDTYPVMLYDSEMGAARPLLPTGISLEPPALTTDYSQVFLVHQVGSDAWIKAVAIDGSSERILVNDALSAEQLTLFNDDRHLVYAIWRNQGWQIELVDVETGQRQLLQDNLKQVRSIVFNEESDTITIWWLGQDDTIGASSYSSDGRLFYQSEIMFSWRTTAAEFWAPDGETAVIKLDGGNGEAVVLAYPDNRESVVVRNGLSGLGDPYWSPDSQIFAFTQLVTPLVSKGIDLEIVDTVGNTLWSFSPFSLNYRGFGQNTLEWVACP